MSEHQTLVGPIVQRLKEGLAGKGTRPIPAFDNEGLRTALSRIVANFDTEEEALRWITKVPVPGYGHKTAKDLIFEGHADWVIEYLDDVEEGTHA